MQRPEIDLLLPSNRGDLVVHERLLETVPLAD